MSLKFRGAKRLGYAAAGVSGLVGAAALLAGPASPAAAQAATCPNAELRQGPDAHLPDCRAYEQVSPVDKNGWDVDYGTKTTPGGAPVSVDGSWVQFVSDGSFVDQPFGTSQQPLHYLSFRSGDGWWTFSPFPHRTESDASPFVSTSGSTPSLGAILLETNNGPLTSEPAPAGGVYRRDNSTGEVELVAAVPTGSGGASDGISEVTASPDLSHVALNLFVRSQGNPTDVDAHEWVQGAGIRPVGIDENGDPFPESTIGQWDSSEGSSRAVSDDGSHVFFATPRPTAFAASEIYRRTDGQVTELASPSKRSGGRDPQGPLRKRFIAATGDGNRVFFVSAEQLTDDANTGPTRAGSDLYRYDFAADELVDISATPGGDGARVLGMLGYSANGERVYYAARGQVVPGEGTAGEANIYLWEDDGTPDGQTRYVATIDPAEEDNWNWRLFKKSSRVTVDTRYLLFETAVTQPAAPHPHDGTTEVYRYDAAGGGQTVCVSCPDRPPAGDALVTGGLYGIAPRQLPRALAAGGERVFFDTADSLVSRDTNGRIDPYMWEDGQVHLLSSGRSPDDARFFNASADGDSAFFLTRERLAPSDGDTAVDLYVARVNGGFPAPPSPSPCTGDECQGPAPEPPPPPASGSSDFTGPGNLEPEAAGGSAKRCERLGEKADKAKRKARKAKRKLKRVRRKARRAEGKRARRLSKRVEHKKQRAKRLRRKARQAKRKARSCASPQARQAGCERLERRADRAKRRARRFHRRAERASGKRARRIERRADRGQKRARQAKRRARNCKRGGE